MYKSILITGGAGFIGSNIATALVNSGYKVTIVDNLSSGSLDNVPKEAKFYKCDINDPYIGDIILEEQVDTVSHHAAQANVRVSLEDPKYDAHENIIGTLNVIKACEKVGVKRFLFASSGGTVYGQQRYFPADEEHPCYPISPYGCAKLSVERYLLCYNSLSTLNTVILRYANIYGPRQNPKGEAGIVAIALLAFINGSELKIFGDGTQTRDYVFVEDVVAIHNTIIEKWVSGVYNVGTGKETPLLKLLEVIKSILKPESEKVNFYPPRLGELQRSSLSSEKLYKTFGIKPQTDIKEGLKKTIPFYTEKWNYKNY